MKLQDAHMDTIERTVRDILAVDPIIPMAHLKRQVAKKLDHDYDWYLLKRVLRKVQGQTAVRPNLETANRRIAEMRETYRILREEHMRIAFTKHEGMNVYLNDVSDRQKSLQEIKSIDKILLDAEIRLGIFMDHTPVPGQVTNNVTVIANEDMAAIESALEAWEKPKPRTRYVAPREAQVVKTEETPQQHANEAPGPESGVPAPTAAKAPIPGAFGVALEE